MGGQRDWKHERDLRWERFYVAGFEDGGEAIWQRTWVAETGLQMITGTGDLSPTTAENRLQPQSCELGRGPWAPEENMAWVMP